MIGWPVVEFFDRYRSFWADGPWGVVVAGKRVGAVMTSDPCVGLPDGRVIPESRAHRQTNGRSL